jgi:hypothetical protein
MPVVVLGRKIVFSLRWAFTLAVADSTAGCAAVFACANAISVVPRAQATTRAGTTNLDRMIKSSGL